MSIAVDRSKAHVIKKTEGAWGDVKTVVKRKKFGVNKKKATKKKRRRKSRQ